MKGRRLCGDATGDNGGAPIWNARRHCESRRRATAAPVIARLGAPRSASCGIGARPFAYRPAPVAKRLFRGRCGTSLAGIDDAFPDQVILYAACLEDPETNRPDLHTQCGERPLWLAIDDDPPKLTGSNQEAKT